MIETSKMRCRGAGRGIEADFGSEHADTFRRDLHPDLRADHVLAKPPFNPAERGTNSAWVQHFIHHLAPFFFWDNLIPQGEFTRGDRRRFLRVHPASAKPIRPPTKSANPSNGLPNPTTRSKHLL